MIHANPASQKGFSLIELMIVVAIVGVLSAVAIPQYQNYVMRAKWSVNLSQIEPLKLAIAECLLENGMTSTACDSSAEIQATLPQPKYVSANGVTLSSTTSLSQSRRISCTVCTWPDSSPLNHSLLRERLKYTALFSSAVFCSASRFIQANIKTSPVSFSWAMTGTKPLSSHLI